MEEMTIGIISAPDLPTSNANAIKDKLAQSLPDITDRQIKWHVAVQVSPLTGVAEKVSDMMDEAKKLKKRNGWDLAICLTDLPAFRNKNVVVADTYTVDGIAHISLPALGALPTPKRTHKIVLRIVKELYTQHVQKTDQEERHKKTRTNKRKETLHFYTIRRIPSPEDVGGVDIRFVIQSKVIGLIQVLLGMSIANRPWTIMPSFKSVVALAFASGAYGLIFPTLWRLSLSYDLFRFFALMVASIFAMVVWIIFAHNLWERPDENTTSRLRPLYNAATILTLTFSILMYYVILFTMFLLAVLVFVPPELFHAQTEQQIVTTDYLKLAWLVTSVATVAGAIGSGLEKTEEVGKITYGYRQYLRYEQAKQDEKQEDENKFGKSTEDE